MLQFISMGSGSSGNCYCLLTENNGLMIDAGLGIRNMKKSFVSFGLSISRIHHILITHDHADHVKSVGRLSKTFGLPVYATEKVHAGIDGNYCVHQKIEAELRRYVEVGNTFHLGDFEITPFHVPHDSNDNVGYKIVFEDVCLVLMTDVGHVTDEMKQMISSANYLVIEANHDKNMLVSGPYPQHLKVRIAGPNGHLANSDCAIALAENATVKLKHVWLCHLSEENNHPELAFKTVEETLLSHSIEIGTDFDLTVLKRKSPSELYQLD